MTNNQPWYTSIPELRAEVIKKHKRAGSKISYNRTKKGIEIAGSEYDPRVSIDQVKTMNKRQLESYSKKLQAFTDRGTSFVKGDGGAPISTDIWKQLQQTIARYNIKADKAFNRVADTFLPRSGMTVAQRQATLLPKDSVTANGAVTTPHAKIEQRQSTDFASARGVKKLTATLKKKMSQKYDQERVDRARDEASQMIDQMGASDLQERLDRLSDKDFDLLWSYSTFAEDLSGDYEWWKLRAAGYRKDDLDAAVMDEAKRAAVIEGLDWIESLKKSRGKKG